jgi:ketosteroid isomerase-like protein
MNMGSKHLFVKRTPLSHRLLKWGAPVLVLLVVWIFLTSGLMDNLHTRMNPAQPAGTLTITQSVNPASPVAVQTTDTSALIKNASSEAASAGTEPANSNSPNDTHSTNAVATAVINPTPPSAAAQAMPTTPVEPPDLEPQGETAVRNAVEAWRKAWQTRDLPAYLGLYGPNFAPPQGASRQVWADTRRTRISSKQKIELRLKNLTLQMQGNTATVKFTQVYADERVSMANRKTMVWQQADGRWLIQSETTD